MVEYYCISDWNCIFQDLHSLNELFRVGMQVRCKVIEVTVGKKGRRKIRLTINPREVNQALKVTDLKNGMVLYILNTDITI